MGVRLGPTLTEKTLTTVESAARLVDAMSKEDQHF
jgi:hypothetical protein